MPDPAVAVVVPTLDAGDALDSILEALRRETAEVPAEVLVIDSSSQDSTADRARRAGATVHVIPRERFGHGRTRNWAATLTSAPLVAYLTQDALPQEGWLRALVAPFDDPHVAGVYGRQIPRPGAYAFEAARIRKAFPPWRQERSAEWETPGDRERYGVLGLPFSNVNSCVRRSVLTSLPFPDAEFAEDQQWAESALRAGHRIVYEPAACVLHSHSRDKYISEERQRSAFRALGPAARGRAPFPALPWIALLNALEAWAFVREEVPSVRVLGQGYLDALTIEVRKWWWTRSPPR